MYCVYAFKGDLVKVGFTGDIKRRFNQLKYSDGCKRVWFKIMTPSALQARAMEVFCHKYLAEYNVHGEWFKVQKKKVIEAMVLAKSSTEMVMPFLKNHMPRHLAKLSFEYLVDNIYGPPELRMIHKIIKRVSINYSGVLARRLRDIPYPEGTIVDTVRKINRSWKTQGYKENYFSVRRDLNEQINFDVSESTMSRRFKELAEKEKK